MKPNPRFTGVDVAIALIRPNARYEFNGHEIVWWDDPRPKPSMEEIKQVQQKAKAFEESINTIWLPEDLEKIENLNL